jgi:hypothetical protein
MPLPCRVCHLGSADTEIYVFFDRRIASRALYRQLGRRASRAHRIARKPTRASGIDALPPKRLAGLHRKPKHAVVNERRRSLHTRRPFKRSPLPRVPTSNRQRWPGRCQSTEMRQHWPEPPSSRLCGATLSGRSLSTMLVARRKAVKPSGASVRGFSLSHLFCSLRNEDRAAAFVEHIFPTRKES